MLKQASAYHTHSAMLTIAFMKEHPDLPGGPRPDRAVGGWRDHRTWAFNHAVRYGWSWKGDCAGPCSAFSCQCPTTKKVKKQCSSWCVCKELGFPQQLESRCCSDSIWWRLRGGFIISCLYSTVATYTHRLGFVSRAKIPFWGFTVGRPRLQGQLRSRERERAK